MSDSSTPADLSAEGDDFDFDEAWSTPQLSFDEAAAFNVTSDVPLAPADEQALEAQVGLGWASAAITGTLSSPDVLWDPSDDSADSDETRARLTELLDDPSDTPREMSLIFLRPAWQRQLLCAPTRLARLLLTQQIREAWDEAAALGPVSAASVAAATASFIAAHTSSTHDASGTPVPSPLPPSDAADAFAKLAAALNDPGSDYSRALAAASPPGDPTAVAQLLRVVSHRLTFDPSPEEAEVMALELLEPLSPPQRQQAVFALAAALGLVLLLSGFATGRDFDHVLAELAATEQIFSATSSVTFTRTSDGGFAFYDINHNDANTTDANTTDVNPNPANPDSDADASTGDTGVDGDHSSHNDTPVDPKEPSS